MTDRNEKNIIVRSAALSDVRRLGLIHALTWNRAYRDFLGTEEKLVPKKSSEMLQKTLQTGSANVLVAERDHKVEGFVVFGGTRLTGPANSLRDQGKKMAEIWAIYVRPGASRSGIGRALLSRAERMLVQLGYKFSELWMLEHLEPARSFYIAMNYFDTGEVDEAKLPGSRLLKLAKSL